MRYSADQKEETRLKMLAAAGRGFRSHGYSGIGVDGLAKAAEVTSGAFYTHFGSKDEAFEAVLVEGLDEVIDAIPRLQEEHGVDWVKVFAKHYLSEAHRNNMACGCAMATLIPEVVRSGSTMHAVFEKKMPLIVNLAARGLAGSSDEGRRDRAWAMLGVLIGGINIARAMKSKKAAGEVADSIETAAIKAAGRTRTIVSAGGF